MEYSGAGGKLIHEKNQKQKISWHCPFKGPKKSQPPLKFSILARGHLKGAQKVSAPFKSQDFHCPPLQMGRVMGFPA